MLSTLTLAVSFSLTGFALQTRTDDTAAQNRFSTGFPNDPVENASNDFILSGHDLSGIGWQTDTPNKGFAMVSPRHFVAANHYRPATNDSVTFNNRDGDLVTIGIESVTTMNNADNSGSDLVVGTLDRPIVGADKIGYFSVADFPLDILYLGRELYVYGTTPKVGLGTIAGFQQFGSDPITSGSGLNPTQTYQFVYQDLAGNNNDAYFQVGDSGSPSFIMYNGQLLLTGVHSALVDTGTVKVNYDTFVPYYLEDVDSLLGSTGYELTRVVPEPSAWALIIGASALGLAFVWRRKT